MLPTGIPSACRAAGLQARRPFDAHGNPSARSSIEAKTLIAGCVYHNPKIELWGDNWVPTKLRAHRLLLATRSQCQTHAKKLD